ncbi:MAG: mechanosensitive ion channel [Proteobacteria bacterium]|nr:mechanosensitive ion channel [Pseudomonadota bacterium]MBU4297560.1 mechanosensitive ion channel [Pseudomonadota bacterium]MCG2749083.1 mechanosensitive ion channel [Desulfobulbaceae bacterium]
MDFDHIFETVSFWVSTHSVKLLAALLGFFAWNCLIRRIFRPATRLIEKYRVKLIIFHFLDNFLCYTLLILVLVTATCHLSIKTKPFQIVIGIAALVAGLVVKDSLSGIAASLILILPWSSGWRQGLLPNFQRVAQGTIR